MYFETTVLVRKICTDTLIRQENLWALSQSLEPSSSLFSTRVANRKNPGH